MNRIYGAIRNLTNALRVYAALEVQDTVPGKIVEARASITKSRDNSQMWEFHFIKFKRTRDNQVVEVELHLQSHDPVEEIEPYGAPFLKIRCKERHEGAELVAAILRMFGGLLQIRPDDSSAEDYPWDEIKLEETDWLTQITPGRAAQIKLVDLMKLEGLELLEHLGIAEGGNLLKLKEFLNDERPVAPWTAEFLE